MWVERLVVARHSRSGPIGQGLLSQQPYKRPCCCRRRRISRPLLLCASALAEGARLTEKFEDGARTRCDAVNIAQTLEMKFLGVLIELGSTKQFEGGFKAGTRLLDYHRSAARSHSSRASCRSTERRNVGGLSRCAGILLRNPVLQKSVVVVAARLTTANTAAAYYSHVSLAHPRYSAVVRSSLDSPRSSDGKVDTLGVYCGARWGCGSGLGRKWRRQIREVRSPWWRFAAIASISQERNGRRLDACWLGLSRCSCAVVSCSVVRILVLDCLARLVILVQIVLFLSCCFLF